MPCPGVYLHLRTRDMDKIGFGICYIPGYRGELHEEIANISFRSA